jgi:hypothetical protein
MKKRAAIFMQRKNSFLVHATRHQPSYALTDIEESHEVSWNARIFRSLPGAGFYDFLRRVETGTIVGVELHLTAPQYDDKLRDIPGFQKQAPIPTFDHRWRFFFDPTHKDSEVGIQWEQILSSNPFLGCERDVLLILQTSHLSAVEYHQLMSYVPSNDFGGKLHAREGFQGWARKWE